jgi:hypothetical protein
VRVIEVTAGTMALIWSTNVKKAAAFLHAAASFDL